MIYNLHGTGFLNREIVTHAVDKFFTGDDEDEVLELRSDMTDCLMKKFDVDKDGLISYEDYSSVVIKQPLLLEFLGKCFPSLNGMTVIAYCANVMSKITIPKATPKYQTAYACEGKKLTIECDPGDLINLIRANYGRFSITICNDHGNVEWSVNCMFPRSLSVLNSKCSHKQSCSVLATTSMFGDPCPGTHKYLEAHYQCISAAQSSTTTNRPSPPPLGGSLPLPAPEPPRPPLPGGAGAAAGSGVADIWNALSSSPGPPTQHTTLPGGRLKGGYNSTAIKNANRHDGLPPPPPLHHHHHGSHHPTAAGGGSVEGTNGVGGRGDHNKTMANNAKSSAATSNTTTPPNTRILTGVGGSGSDDGTLLTTKTAQNRGGNQQQQTQQSPTGSTGGDTVATANAGGNFSSIIRTINNINNINAGLGGGDEDETNMFCGPTNARNLFWNVTRVGDVNVQPCPGGATGIAKWRCVLMKRVTDGNLDDDINSTEPPMSPKIHQADCNNSSNGNCETPTTLANKVNQRLSNFEPTWHPVTPDLTQCRSLWLNNLEVRVNQRDSSLISIANDLSEVTSSKTLYGGDMLVTTKIIQTMSEKMFHDKETFPDQRQREAIILELLHGVVKTGSNLLDESQLSSWLDLNQEDQMRVATSLLTGLEYNAFLLADTIIRERNVVQKVKNILLSVRVLETKNIQANEVFPDAEQWQISDDRIELPRAALVENSEGGLVRIVFAAFDRLESILKPSYDHFDLKSARSYVRNTAILTNESDSTNAAGLQQRIRILNSKVISASLGKGRHIQLSQPIRLIFRHLKTENVTNPTCVFWNYIDHAWSANGCNLESTNRTHSICICNHLTNFAILMDVMDEHSHSLFTMFDGNMRILIYISISICLVFIVIALLTLKIFNGGFIKSARTSIYRSIYVCLLLIEILFLFGIEQTETSLLCGFTTVFLHCSILSAIAWFCFEAFQSYSTLTTDDMLLEVDQTSKINCYYLLSYGLSFTIVAISLAINPSTYTQNDFCVLMESNALFYVTFVTPVMIFVLGALGYTFLSWIIMCRKSRTTLKNKEHTRLANVRFDIRCSFIFLLLLSGVWISAYYYLRRSKLDDEVALVCGYLFVGFNTLMGLYIFVFHCIQNEKIRREYRKYVRQNSWLPKCLRCSKTSISSGIVGNSSAGAGGAAGTLASNTGTVTGTQMKKSKVPVGDANENDETGGIISAAEDAIMASSDCELNEAQTRRTASGGGGVGGIGTVKSGIMPGNLVLQHGKVNSIIDSMQGHIVLERGGGGSAAGGLGPGASGTLRSTGGGVHTPSAGHTSPTSSAGSTHLIFGHGLKQQAAAGSGGVITGAAQEAFYHHPDYYTWKQQGGGAKVVAGAPLSTAQARDYHGNGAPPQQSHEFFYWTQKHNQHGKKKRGSAVGPDSPSGSLHSRTTATSQQILFYPSYKKTTLKNQQQYHQQYPQYAEALEPAAYYQQQHRRHPSAAAAAAAHHPHMQQQYLQQQQQQQLSSDDEQMESAAHAHLLHLSRRGVPQQLPPPPITSHQYPPTAEFGGGPHAPTQQRYYRNKHSNCDLNQEYDAGRPVSESYYNQGSLCGGDGPVYEEILSNRNSDVQNYHDVGDDEDEDFEVQRNGVAGFGVGGAAGVGIGGGGIGHQRRSNGRQHRRQQQHHRSRHEDDDDDDEDGEDEDESVCGEDDDEDDDGAAHVLPQSDERMRRLMAMQDEDFQRRFQRQQRKNGAVDATTAAASGYHDFDAHQQQHPSNAVFGVSGGGGGGSVRSFKKVSPNSRLAVNELFSHGPPLPPANQHPMQKRQQQQQQQLSPQSTTSTSSSSHLQQQQLQLQQQQLQIQQQLLHQQQQPVGRNISAMLDENNTVRCYLEPLAK